MVRFVKYVSLAVVGLGLSGCAGFSETMDALYEGAVAYEQAEAQRQAQQQAYWSNYTNVGSQGSSSNNSNAGRPAGACPNPFPDGTYDKPNATACPQ